MFIWSIKTSKRELIVLAIGIVIFAAAVVYVLWPRGESRTSALVQSGYSLSVENEQERLAFLTQFGWQVEEEPTEVREVWIPTEFSDVYLEYNEIQKAQGFDLEKYKGERVKRWTYRITNYPGVSGVVVANILIQNGRVVGGDVCSTALDGFMHGFSPQQNADKMADIATAAAENAVDRTVPDSIPEQSDVPPEDDE